MDCTWRDDLRKIRGATLGEVGGAEDVQPAATFESKRDGFALKVMHALEIDSPMSHGIYLAPGIEIEPAVVVSADEDLVLVRKGVEPVYLCLDGCGGTVGGGIAGEDEQIPVGNVGDDRIVCIRDADDFDW